MHSKLSYLLVVLTIFSLTKADFYSNFGYFLVDEQTDANLFYGFFASQNGNQNAPLILWLNGGPGCSSIGMGLLYENGPYSVNSNIQLVPNPNTWNDRYHILYIDSPVGTGFSYVTDPNGYAKDETQIVTQLYKALELFFKRYPSYGSNDFYIFGESYAGKYIPNLATYISKQSNSFNLKGFGIGNGLSDPIVQVTAYAQFAFATGLIDTQQSKIIEDYQIKAVAAIQQQRWDDANNLWNNMTLNIIEWAGWVNPADIRIFGFPDFDAGTKFLNDPEVKKKMGVTKNITFEMCSDKVGEYLLNDQMVSVKYQFPDLLKRYKVILFNGNMDLTVPTNGAEKWINSIQWDGQVEFNKVKRNIWKVDNQTAGFVRQYKNLNQVVVVNAGHMATMDQQKNVRDMVVRFIENKPWN